LRLEPSSTSPPARAALEASPITFTSYGTGKATLVAANDKEFAYAYNAAGLKFTHLIIKGNGGTTHTKDGISFYADTLNTRYAGITFVMSRSTALAKLRGNFWF